MLPSNIDWNLCPWLPPSVGETTNKELHGVARAAANHVKISATRFAAHACHPQLSNLGELIQVAECSRFETIPSSFALLHSAIKGYKNLGAIGSLCLDQPVLWIEKDLACRLPNTIAIHPAPLVPILIYINVSLRIALQVHQNTLHKQLYRSVRLHDAGRYLAR